jgi:CheY-like chemotaxis protein/HPt (histidine-containing phosphotransfer) domain-containing protein
VESQPEKGSVFHFTVRLPAAKELPPERETPGVPPAATSALRILLVEDNPANQKLAAYILRERGHTVDIAGNGEEGWRMAIESTHDVILMDVQMPGMDGLDATKAIRAREDGGRRVPIIAMTAHAMEGDRERCLAGGMDGYLSKPINGREMIALVESLAGETKSPSRPPAPTASANSKAGRVFDVELGLKRCCNDPRIFEEMAQCFFDEVAFLSPHMRAALDRNDLVELGRLAHRLKGTVVYMGAEAATAAVTCVEQLQRCGGTRAEADSAFKAMERACDELKAALAEHRAGSRLQQR